jgi:hypothetical protein
MILKKLEVDGLIKAVYDSSNVIASTYNTKTNDLDIIFKVGSKYRYNKVSRADYMRFEIAESQGTVFSSHIKKYPNVKLDSVDVSKILNETEYLKREELEVVILAKKERMIKTMRGIVLLADGNKYFADNLETLKKEIDEYIEKTKERI